MALHIVFLFFMKIYFQFHTEVNYPPKYPIPLQERQSIRPVPSHLVQFLFPVPEQNVQTSFSPVRILVYLYPNPAHELQPVFPMPQPLFKH